MILPQGDVVMEDAAPLRRITRSSAAAANNKLNNNLPAANNQRKTVNAKGKGKGKGKARAEEEEEEEEPKAGGRVLRNRVKEVNYANPYLRRRVDNKPVAAAAAAVVPAPAVRKRGAAAAAPAVVRKRARPAAPPARARARPAANRRLRAVHAFPPLPPLPQLPRQMTRSLSTIIEEEKSVLVKKREGVVMEWSPELKIADFEMNLDHLKDVVPPLHEELPLEDLSSKELLNILKETEFSAEELDSWKAYGNWNLFNQKDDMARYLETVVNYCESDATAGKGIKNKLRLVTKILKEDKEARSGILCMLAQHGNVCNVMKEVAVNLAYSMLSNNLGDFMKNQSLRTLIARNLQTLRELIVEKLFIAGGNFMNTHPLVAFRNSLAIHIGLDVIPDQHAGANPADKARILNFLKEYSVERMVKTIGVAVNDKHRKIPYEAVVEWLQQNSPKDDAYEFLGDCFDAETGHLNEPAILFILLKLGFLI